MTVEDFNQHPPVEMATNKDILPRVCTTWGIVLGIGGIVTALVMYSRISAGQPMDDDTARGVTTLAGVSIIIGLMGYLAGALMVRINAAKAASEEKMLLLAEILLRLERIEHRQSAPHLGALVGRDVAELAACIETLRRDHDELSEELGIKRPSNVTRLPRQAPVNGSS